MGVAYQKQENLPILWINDMVNVLLLNGLMLCINYDDDDDDEEDE